MEICLRPSSPDLSYLSSLPLILNDEYGHHIKNVSKITFNFLTKNLCVVTVEYPEKDIKNVETVKVRTFFFRSCKINLASVGVPEAKEKFHASLEPACKVKIPLYVRVAMRIVDRFLNKQERVK